VSMSKVEITDECLVQALARVLLNLFHSTDDSSVRKNKLLLPSTLPPSLRLAVRTWLKYYSIETIVVGLDVSTGRVSFDQLEAIKADEVLAIIMSYPNFFGVLENVAEISAWAHQKGIKTIMVADALLLSYLKPPAQLTQNIDFTLCDLQPLGLPVHNKGTAPSLIAGSEHRFNDYSASYMKSAASISELMKIQVFFYSLAVEPLQHACRQANENLTQLVEQLLQIAGISLKFSVPVVNECVLHFEGIDLKRALQILAGHNILAGYPLGEDYPELDNCLLIHCTDQHDEAQIARLVDKITTVVKNLSAAACPVKPKFT
jgi:glycine dehydrogenase subunit 1